ncbi:MAG: hypothetical protein Q8Q76_00300 [Methylotenera sp.]|nr:hypothetical protein [Methylotenera sp.]MDP3742769.1 hypothetical protein [Methylotenera sp.]
MNWKLLFFICLIGFGAFQHFQKREVIHGAGEVVSDPPQQRSLDISDARNINGYEIIPLAKFSIKARVLASKSYHFGREAELAPVDFALGWGAMSDEAVLNKIDISQSNRFYFWHVDEFPIPREAIETQSANMHMIPADSLIEKRLKSVRVGQVVQINGYLVEAKASDGWRWKSSLTRNDIGNGACEVLLVKSIEVH